MSNAEDFKIDFLWIILIALIFIFGTGRGTPGPAAPIVIPG
ncbi:hypothetical protein HNQ80_000156 [Anaerosolibacter carboniphilus]|uniref:Uncharacterized protein n=1 Tax=Anaerosolibacter carboniphilus TaxID=1417629 RepID=A0A841KKW7_9FIRM|nr:hypothetical protein [Anaerosolibacter carboniphilus]MBB6214087.1 hypothetical protein [Anaerosolibacter carboniphilus]